MLQELKSYIFDQDAELVELQKALKEHKQLLAEDTKISFEEKNIVALKRKNRALKNRLAALEAKLQAKKASTMESYFLKPLPQAVADKKIEQEEVRKPKKPLTRNAVEALLQEEEKKEIQKDTEKSEKKDIEEDHAFKNIKKVVDEDLPFKKAEKAEKSVPEEDHAFIETEKKKKEPKSSIEEIKGSLKSAEREAPQKEKSQKPAIAPKAPMPTPPPAPVLPSRSPVPSFGIQGALTQQGPGKQQPFLPNKQEMREVVNSIKESIAQNPEEFEEFIKNVPQPTEEQQENLAREIAAMSPEEQAHFQEFMQNFVSSFVDDEK